MNTVTMTFEERPILVKYKEGDNKDLGFWFIVTGCWLKEKNQKQQTRDRKPNLYSNRPKGGVMQRSRTMTSDQLKIEGLKALERQLGPDGMIRFLQQFETGWGDYTKERHKWLKETSVETLAEKIVKQRNG